MIDQHAAILASPRGTMAQVIDAIEGTPIARSADLLAYLGALFRLAPAIGVDPSVLVAQSHLETAGWISERWRLHRNPAGLAAVDDASPDPPIANGAEAAALHLWAVLVALGRRIDANRIEIPAGAIAFRDRWIAKYEDPNCPTMRTVADLNRRYVDRHGEPQATWAWDPDYGAKLIERWRTLFGGGSMPTSTVTFGRVPLPAMQIRDIAASRAWNDLGPRTIRAVVWHRMLGSLWGTDTYFRGEAIEKALTDYGVGVKAQDGEAADGLILRWNDPRGRRAPWANGPVSAPYGDGKAFVDGYGINAVNRDATAIEISGFQNTPLSEASRNSIAALTAYWADQYRVSWETFPLIPGEGNRSFVVWHQEFTIGTGKECPFAVVMDETPDLIERTKMVLWQYQTGPKPPKWAPKVKPPLDVNGRATIRVVNGVVWHPVNGFLRTTKRATPRQYADPNAKPTGPDLPAGTRVKVAYVVPGADGDLWYVGWGGSRMSAEAFV